MSPEAADNEGFQVVLDPLGRLAYHLPFLQHGTGPRQHIIEVVSEKSPALIFPISGKWASPIL